MPRWLISVPVWGASYVRTFVDCAAPALLAAVRRLGAPVKFMIHTSSPDQVRAALGYWPEVEFRPVGNKPTYVALQESHAEAVAAAAPGDRVVLLNADLVVSGNLLTRCAEHFAVGDLAVVLLGIRTQEDFRARPPSGAEPRELMAWAWAHRHQIIRDLEFPRGRSMLPTNLFFPVGDSVVARCFHMHPAAIVKQESTSFRSTIDGDLLDCYPRERVRVVTDPDDCAMCEISPPARRFPVRDSGGMRADQVAASMMTRASPTHRWLATHRIGVVGPNVDCGDEAFLREVMECMDRAPPVPPAVVGSRRGRDPRGRRGGSPVRLA